MIHRREDLDRKLKQQTPFLKGVWILICLCGRFLWSLGPHNWSMAKIANAGKEDPMTHSYRAKPTTSEANTLK